MKKRIISAVVAVAVILSAVLCINLSVSAASDDCSASGSSVKWSYDSSTTTLTITGTGAVKDYGVTGTNRVPWYSYKSQITAVVVDEGVTELGTCCFYGCSALTSVSLPSSLKIIAGGTLNYGAFRECTSLASITLPEGLEKIEAMAFRGCTALTAIKFPDSLTSLGTSAFRDCTALRTVTYGTGMTSTGFEAFYDSGVRAVNFSSTITAIDAYSFFNTGFTTVEIPESVTSIGTRAFANCAFLRTATVYNASCEFKGIIGEDPFNGSGQTLTMRGHSGSTTETYASEKGYLFESIDECSHPNTSEVITKEATCTETGISQQVCDNCGAVVSETEIAATGHDWEAIEVSDQTAVDGHIYTVYNCTYCSETKTVIEHKAYVEGYYEYTNTATCTKTGIETYKCIVDGCTEIPKVSVAPKGNHTVDEYTVTAEPTCTEAGSKEGVCSVCGETVTKEIPATGHTETGPEILDNTQEDGHTYEIYTCSVCGEQRTVPTHVEWVEGNYTSTVITQPRCVINGLQRDKCDICGTTRNVTLPANGQHDWYVTSETEPACTTKGYIYYACRNCDLTKTDTKEALGHDWVYQQDSSQPATCTTAGYASYKCARCAMTNKEVINATGHTADSLNYTIITEATCEEDGLATSVCITCGEEFEITLQMLGHNMEDVITAIEEKPGHSMATPTCTRCGYADTGSVVHDEWIEGCYENVVITAGSCTVARVTRDKCNYCSETRSFTTPAPGHSYSYTKTTNAGALVYTCANDGCGNEITRTASNVAGLFINYVNTNSADNSLGYLFDLTGDGFINAKDYALINRAVIKEKANNAQFNSNYLVSAEAYCFCGYFV